MTLATIEIDTIEVGNRLREISEAQVETLIASIGDVGLLNPVTVYPRETVVGGLTVPGYGLVAGAHRLEACTRLGLADIAAQIVDLSDLERQIAECDENLCATVLSKSDRALFTKRRKQAYEALHPETKHGSPGVSRQVGDTGNRAESNRFTADTASKTGQSERAVQRDAERGDKISERALAMIRGTRLDTGSYLDKIKRLDGDRQIEQVKEDLTPRRPVPPPSTPHNPMEAYNKWASEMNRIWSRAPQEWRDRWIAQAETPVFDRNAA